MMKRYREVACALLVDELGRLLLQQRDDKPDIVQPGKVGLFGGHREIGETYLECVVREVREEISFYVPPNGFAHLEGFEGPDPEVSYGRAHAEFYFARHVPVEKIIVTEGALLIISSGEVDQIASKLTPFARMAIESFLGRD